MTNFSFIKIFIFFIFLITAIDSSAQVKALPNAHAHNDYKHKHPLSDALKNGFTSIEADVFLKNNCLIVAHISPVLKNRKTLESLYLKPLQDSINKHNGSLYQNYNEPIILLIDIKTDAEKTYTALKPLLEKYKSILTSYENGKITKRAVTIIISGKKPYDQIKNESYRLAFIDEGLLNIEKNNFDATICPLASTKYSNILKWKGKGNIPADEKQKLIGLVSQAHKQGKKVRLWASPENKIVWKELLDCDVDLINTDDLEELKEFLDQYKSNL